MKVGGDIELQTQMVNESAGAMSMHVAQLVCARSCRVCAACASIGTVCMRQAVAKRRCKVVYARRVVDYGFVSWRVKLVDVHGLVHAVKCFPENTPRRWQLISQLTSVMMMELLWRCTNGDSIGKLFVKKAGSLCIICSSLS